MSYAPPSSSAPPPAGWTATGQPMYGQPKMGEAPPPYPGAAPPVNVHPPTHAYYMTPGAQQQTTTTTTVYSAPIPPPTHQTTTVIVTGNCPKCHVGHLREENNAAMCILVAILAFIFFPIGLLYFLCLPAAVVHHCDHCGYTC